MTDTTEVDRMMDSAADAALDARRRIEVAIDAGDLPAWVLGAFDQLEHAALAYGAARACRPAALRAAAPSKRLH